MATVLVAVMAGVVGPAIVVYLTGRQKLRDKRAEWDRQDDMASRAAAAAAVINGQLKVIHTLVNSNLTASIRAQYEAKVLSLALLKENIAMHRDTGVPPTNLTLNNLAVIESEVAELRTTLAKREEQDALAKAQGEQVTVEVDAIKAGLVTPAEPPPEEPPTEEEITGQPADE